MTKAKRRQLGKKRNAVGEMGELLFEKLCPSAIRALPNTEGYDYRSIDGKFIEIKTSRFDPLTQGWRFTLSERQCYIADYVVCLALNEFGGLFKWWVIPVDEIPARSLGLNEFNLRLFSKWEVSNEEV